MKQLSLITLFLILATTAQALFSMKVSEQQQKQNKYLLTLQTASTIIELLNSHNEGINQLKTTETEIVQDMDSYDWHQLKKLPKKEYCLIVINKTKITQQKHTVLPEKILQIQNINDELIKNYNILINNIPFKKKDINTPYQKKIQKLAQAKRKAINASSQLITELEQFNKRIDELEETTALFEKDLKELKELKETELNTTAITAPYLITTTLGFGYCAYKLLGIFF